jgi:hypothetical protein
MARRQEAFYDLLNVAGRTGDVKFKGTRVETPWSVEPSPFGPDPEKIPASYFGINRSFDEDGSIHAMGPDAPDPSPDGKHVSCRNMVVERAAFVRFLQANYPVPNAKIAQAQLNTNEAISHLARVLRLEPDTKKGDAAALVGLKARSRHFEHTIWPKARERADLPRQGQPGRKRKSPQN